MARQIDTDAVINSIRLAEQAGDVGAIAAGYWQLYGKEGGLYFEDDNEVVSGPLGTNFAPSGRLTLTTATPVTTADVSAAATLYYTPYNGNMISLYDGARWIPVVYTEKSLAIGAYTASKPYDIWGYLSSNTLALESTVWTDATTRATALAYQDGRLVKSGTATRLYLGTIYINSSGGQTDDSITKRNVWNYYNRVGKRMLKTDATSHAYGTGTWRAWNNDATQIIEFTMGVAEDANMLSIYAQAYAGNVANPWFVSIGLDVVNAEMENYCRVSGTPTTQIGVGSSVSHLPTAGRHYYSAIEIVTAGANAQFVQMALRGLIRC